MLNLEGLYISLGGYTRHPFHGDIHRIILLVGLQHCCTESLASPYIIAIIVDTTFFCFWLDSSMRPGGTFEVVALLGCVQRGLCGRSAVRAIADQVAAAVEDKPCPGTRRHQRPTGRDT
jgi:hypothetical protein